MRPPGGRSASVRSGWCHSPTHRPVAAICYKVEPVDGPARITLQSELTANEELPPAGADPRVAAALEDPLRGKYHDATGTAVVLVHKTRRSGLRPGAAMDHIVDCPAPVRAESRSLADGGLVTATTVLAPGQKLRVIKFGG
jgi:alpha,alpha-trehalose phosphorylase